ncbi:MAG: SCO family protein [Deltaproteobacteria bacterium]|nr:SCO family protein [Deltaproteobacteria bacterium]
MRRVRRAAIALAAAFLVGSAAADTPKYQRTIETFTIPDVVLVNQNGEKVRLKRLLESDRPVIVDYIYGTCTTICPVLSAGFSNLQKKLGSGSQNVRLVSITIDPENDTPKIMKDYLKRYGAKPGWEFLTGSRADINKVMRAFNAYMPDKMSHLPLNFIRAPKDGTWVRLYGLMSSRDLMSEVQKAGSP